MNTNLYGKNALVCGASKGIGKASAIQLASLGANVTLVSRSADLMSDVIKEMQLDIPNGQDHDFLVADFSITDDLNKKVKGLVSHRKYHILVNNTGGPPAGPITEAKTEDFIAAFQQHLICNHLLVGLLKKGMIDEGYGRIINIISTSVKAPLDNLGVSNTTRGAVASWAKTMANELGPHGITVNNVLPGFTDTQRLRELFGAAAESRGVTYEVLAEELAQGIPVKRFAEAKEIGAAVAWLASPSAAYVNGINLPVDGGRTRSL